MGPRHLAFWSGLFLRYDADSLRAAEMRVAAGLQAATRSAGGGSKDGAAVKCDFLLIFTVLRLF